jgi:hypothetical protein
MILSVHRALLFVTVAAAACGENTELVSNRTPLAFAGFDRIVHAGTTVQLDGSGSTDPDGNGLSYAWRVVQGSTDLQVDSADDTFPTLSLPLDFSGRVVVELVVSDGAETSDPDWVGLTVLSRQETPVLLANAGSNRFHSTDSGALILSAAASTTAPGSIFRWVHVRAPDGEPRTLGSSTDQSLGSLAAGEHIFGLSVGLDGRWSVPDFVTIVVGTTEPTGTFPAINTPEPVSVGDSIELTADDAEAPSWVLVSSPSGASEQLDSRPNGSVQLALAAAGLYVVSVTNEHGLSDWIGVLAEVP